MEIVKTKWANIFYLIFISAIVAVRTEVFFFPQRKIIINGTLIHHFWVGVILALLAALLPKSYTKWRLGLFSIGLGLMADELVYMILGGGTVSQYWSIYSVFGAIVLAAIIFSIRERLTRKI